ncbi:hypothetical protein BCV70DRAFT_200709 [Testicularia cyperi]|uniref:Uncharacterized protein n=1 Tax=Testicularia cyperi TaxID=1882483 RepID=A0A317XPJ9_9BASI|nr:hypothetical protein BCV70DRAFT_200709 [Testicularia cyperi]
MQKSTVARLTLTSVQVTRCQSAPIDDTTGMPHFGKPTMSLVYRHRPSVESTPVEHSLLERTKKGKQKIDK